MERSEKIAYFSRLEELLGCGRYQYFQIFFLTGLASFLGSTFFFQLSFTTNDGQHRCALPPEIEKKYVRSTSYSFQNNHSWFEKNVTSIASFLYEAFKDHPDLVDTCAVAKFVGGEECFKIRSIDKLKRECFDINQKVIFMDQIFNCPQNSILPLFSG